MAEGPSASGIVATGLARSFGSVQAVRDVTFEARPGEITALIGPNGSGKTTLLLMLASLLAPERGEIRVAGHDPVADPTAVRRVMGWMPDVLGSWAPLSVRTTLELTARLYGIPKQVARDRAEELIELVDLLPLADRPTRVLSRGQKQRLSLARALVHSPEVLLLDEPASGLDPGARVALRKLLRQLADGGRTILVSSHVLAELEEMADAAVYLDAGVTASAERIAAARAAGREWRIRSLDATALREALGSTAARWEGADAIVALTDDTAATQLLARLVADGVPVLLFAPSVGDLEQTFLGLSTGASS
ncbi:ABC transporter ATP-binding protein [Pseudolysinimonas yzui]|uniref:Multidrug ABC transporter ATP-binding protein n=1 Tax=Pseudolysinimonas yzui TaxID=2708254 RepID=A0A8J3GRL6_9MICO|nr:ABC transporter ATP-binding protein [Pseudolysinimonas yzui]GHF18751.1 multidrug ABC transporter ATP-binding protein [Pseudolysinimonas yzui]